MKLKHPHRTLRNLSPGLAQVGARRRPFLPAISLVLTIFSLCWPREIEAATTPIPGLPQWESQMLAYGQIHCNMLRTSVDRYGNPQNFDSLLFATYYDAMDVYLQIAKYTKVASWQACAKAAKDIYRDGYVVPNNGQVSGYWNFTNGLVRDYQVNADVASKDAAILLSQNAAFAGTWAPLEYSVRASVSREVAYTIRAYLNAEKLGAPRRARLADLVNQAYGHIDQWFISKSFRNAMTITDPIESRGQYYIQPFMVGLTMEALIMYYEATSDPYEKAKVVSNVKLCLDWLWAKAWIPANQAFWYEHWVSSASVPFPSKAGSPDLNLLIAPVYAWYYQITGDTIYRDRGDQAFEGGVKGAYLEGAKQFNQNYSYGFDYVSRRRAGDLRITQTTAGVTPSTTPITFVGPAITESLVEAPSAATGIPTSPAIEPIVVPPVSTPPTTTNTSSVGNTVSSPGTSAPANSAPPSGITSPSADDLSAPLKKGRKCKYAMSIAC
jgi:hypothetical protein